MLCQTKSVSEIKAHWGIDTAPDIIYFPQLDILLSYSIIIVYIITHSNKSFIFKNSFHSPGSGVTEKIMFTMIAINQILQARKNDRSKEFLCNAPLKEIFVYLFSKQTKLMRRSTSLNLPPQLVFPGQILGICQWNFLFCFRSSFQFCSMNKNWGNPF